MDKYTFTIITPCLNAENLIEETMTSVLNNSAVQKNRVNLEYIICDGGSKDSTVIRAKKLIALFQNKNINIKFISEPDSGLYDALSKGLNMGTGDFYAYINAGDLYSPAAFDIVLDLYLHHRIKWISGFRVLYNDASQIIYVNLPFRYRRRLIQAGLYNDKILPFIQQESTFWHESLNSKIDVKQLKKHKFAGDYYLWKTFSAYEELNIAAAWIGGFKKQSGQLSEDINAYVLEMKLLSNPPGFTDFFIAFIDRILWHIPDHLKKMLNKKTIFKYDYFKQRFN